MIDTHSVVLEKRGQAFWITINRPEKRNALCPLLIEELTMAIDIVRQPLQEMGRLAVSLLIRLMERQRLDALHVELATELVVRDSTGPAPRGVARPC